MVVRMVEKLALRKGCWMADTLGKSKELHSVNLMV